MRRLLVPLTILGGFAIALGCGHSREDVCNNCCGPAVSNCCSPGGAAPPGVALPGQPVPGGGAVKDGSEKVPDMPPPGKNGSKKAPDMPPADKDGDKTSTSPAGKESPEPSLKKGADSTPSF
jgi:hypothetical protein